MDKLTKKLRVGTVDAVGSEFDDLLARMQKPKARKAMKAAFNASPAQLGRAAVKGARQKRKLRSDR